MNTASSKRTAKLPAVLNDVDDFELRELQAELDALVLENQATLAYIIHVERDISDAEAKAKANKINFEDAAEEQRKQQIEIEASWKVYESLFKIYATTPRKCAAFDEFTAMKQQLLMSTHNRKDEFNRLKKEFDTLIEDLGLKKSYAEIETLENDIAGLKQTMKELLAQDKALDEQLALKDAQTLKSIDRIEKEIVEIDKKLDEGQKFLDSNIEEQLMAEIAEMESELMRISQDADDDCSTCSESVEVPSALPTCEKDTTDLPNFFKNPNDFSLATLFSPAVCKQPNPVVSRSNASDKSGSHSGSAVIAAKKARIDNRQVNSKLPISQKNPVSVSVSTTASRSGSQKRKLRSTGGQQNSQASAKSPQVSKAPPIVGTKKTLQTPPVVIPPTSEKQSAVKILPVQKSPAILQATEKIPSCDTVGSPTTKEVTSYQPRRLNEEYGPTNKKQARMDPVEVVQAVQEDSCVPAANQTELVSIPETPETLENENMEKEVGPTEIAASPSCVDSLLASELFSDSDTSISRHSGTSLGARSETSIGAFSVFDFDMRGDGEKAEGKPDNVDFFNLSNSNQAPDVYNLF